MIQTREDCAKFLAGGRDKTCRTIRRNLRVLDRGDGEYAVQYHCTDIVTYHADGTVTLHNGGYNTSSTRTNINTFSPLTVWQKHYNWYITLAERDIPFRDCMRIDPITQRIVN